MTIQPSNAPPFVLLDVTWTCVIVTDPDDPRPGAAAHVWRSDCGRLEVRRLGADWLAFVDGVPGGLRHGTPSAAMYAATAASKARVA